jgi:hypothetical protein
MGPLLDDSEEIGDVNEADGDTVDVRAHFRIGTDANARFHLRLVVLAGVVLPRSRRPNRFLRPSRIFVGQRQSPCFDGMANVSDI